MNNEYNPTKVYIEHNPYTKNTNITIDSKSPSIDSDLIYIINHPERINKWAKNLDEYLTESYDDTDYNFTFHGIEEDFNVIKEVLEKSQLICTKSIEFIATSNSIENAEQKIKTILNDIKNGYYKLDSNFEEIYDSVFNKNEPDFEKRIENVCSNAKKLYCIRTLNNFQELKKSERIVINNRIRNLKTEIEKTEKYKQEILDEFDSAYDRFKLKKNTFSFSLEEKFEKEIAQNAPKGKRFSQEELDSTIDEITKTVTSIYEKHINDLSEYANNFGEKKLARATKLYKIYLEQNGIKLPENNLSAINDLINNYKKFEIIEFVPDNNNKFDNNLDTKTFKQAKTAEKIAKGIGAASAVLLSPIGAVISSSLYGISKSHISKNGYKEADIYNMISKSLTENISINCENAHQYTKELTIKFNSFLKSINAQAMDIKSQSINMLCEKLKSEYNLKKQNYEDLTKQLKWFENLDLENRINNLINI